MKLSGQSLSALERHAFNVVHCVHWQSSAASSLLMCGVVCMCRLYQKLDHLMLLAEGHLMYYGKAHQVRSWIRQALQAAF